MLKIVAAGPEAAGAAEGEAQHELPHVLLVVDQLAKTLGGGERIVLKLAAYLPQYGYRPSILTFFAHPESAALKSPPCTVYLLPLNKIYGLTAIQCAVELSRLLERERIQIVQTFFESSDLFAGFVTKVLSEAKLVWSRRDMGILRNWRHRLAYRLMAGAPDAVFAVSERVRRHAIEVDGIDPARVRTIFNGLDVSHFAVRARSARAPGEFLVTTVGNIRRVKGHDIFLKAAVSVVQQFPNVRFSIGGEVLEPAYFAELQTLVEDLNLTRHVRFEGGVTNIRKHLAGADIFVLPSRSEGFSNAIVEAMAASLPVVATDVGGNSEAVKDGINGLLIPAEDPEALSAALLKLLSHPPLAKAMGAAGRRLAVDGFTTEAMMNRIAGAYRDLLCRG